MTTKINIDKLNKAISTAEQRLLNARNSQGFWQGYLSSSIKFTGHLLMGRKVPAGCAPVKRFVIFYFILFINSLANSTASISLPSKF